MSLRQVDELNVCWNSVICRLFGYNRWESVSAVLFGLGRLNIIHLMRRVKFYNCGAFLFDLFFLIFLQNFCNDDMLSYAFWSKCDAVKRIWTLFEACVNF